jgi:hypothetical protein
MTALLAIISGLSVYHTMDSVLCVLFIPGLYVFGLSSSRSTLLLLAPTGAVFGPLWSKPHFVVGGYTFAQAKLCEGGISNVLVDSYFFYGLDAPAREGRIQ